QPRYEIDGLLLDLEKSANGEVNGPSVASQLASGNVEAVRRNVADGRESPKSISSTTMRVDVQKLDALVNLIGELVLERNRLLQLAKEGGHETNGDSPLSQSAARLSVITEELQATGLRTRMVPIDTIFCRFPRLVHDLARSLNKQVSLVLQGQE